MYYLSLDIRKVAEVGPKGPDGEEMKTDANFERVMEFARFTECDCCLKIYRLNFISRKPLECQGEKK